jgi:hypothetical protein
MGWASIKTAIFSMLSLVVLSSYSYAGSAKEEYELSEKCGKRTDDFFRKEYGNGVRSDKESTTMTNYTNHCNRKLNKCFMLITSNVIYNKREKGSIIFEDLWDINENKCYGSLARISNTIKPNQCEVGGKYCNSEGEWDEMVKPYMEE